MLQKLLLLVGHVGEQAGLLVLLKLVSHQMSQAEQREHAEAPAPENDPELQGRHKEDPTCALYEPIGQKLQLCPASEYIPAGHGRQTEEELAYVPPAHVNDVQLDAPAVLVIPCWHASQLCPERE